MKPRNIARLEAALIILAFILVTVVPAMGAWVQP